MATFADLAILLLTFFILLLTFAEMDIVKFKDALGSIQAAMGGGTGSQAISVPVAPMSLSLPNRQMQRSDAAPTASDEASMKEIANLVEVMVEKQKLEEDVEVRTTARGVIVRVKGGLFFNPGTADLKDEAKPVLNKISDLMSRFPYEMSVEGHTDNVKISGGRFSSNWDLSAERAYSTLHYLRGVGGVNPRRLHIAGFADTKPIAPNDTPEGRAKNRRVEFVFYRQHLKFEDGDYPEG